MDAKRCDRCGCYYDNNGESAALFNNSKIISKNIPRTYGIGVCFKDIYGARKIQDAMYRPCFVDGKKALFHRWTAYNVIDYAIVEYEDGTVDIVHPQSIRFVPGKFDEYNFTMNKRGKKDL